jgi:iron complex outermembrane receptor protein
MGTRGRHTWVAGAAFQQDRFELRELPAFDYRFSSPSIFAQDEIAFNPKVTLAASARADFHSEYGVLAAPRVSVLLRPAENWTIRSSIGTGAFTPTPFTEETDETGLSRVEPLRDLVAERAAGGSVDLTRAIGPVELTGTLFGSRVDHALQSRDVSPASVELFNAGEATRTWGAELIARHRIEGFSSMVTYAWTHSTEPDPHTASGATCRSPPRTPRRSTRSGKGRTAGSASRSTTRAASRLKTTRTGRRARPTGSRGSSASAGSAVCASSSIPKTSSTSARRSTIR